MNFFKTSTISAVSNLISIVARLVLNKVIAFVGPANFAIYGQFKDLFVLLTSISQLGTENGIVKYTAETQANKTNYGKFLSTSITIHLISSIITSLIVLAFNNQINEVLFKKEDYSSYIIIICSTLTFAALYNLLLHVINGLKDIKTHTFITLTATVVSAILTIILVKLFSLQGLLYSIGINNILFIIIALFFLRGKELIPFKKIKLKIDKTYVPKLLGFSLMSLAGIISLSLSLLFIRTLIIDELSTFDAGIWDSLWRLSAIYFVFLTSSFKFYLLPTFSTIENSLLKNEVLKIWKITFPVILLITATIFLGKDLLIRILFTKEFLAIKSIILFQLLGDIFRIHSWVIGNVLIAKVKTKAFVILQLIWALIFCSSSYLFLKTFGLIGVTYAFCFTSVLHFIFLNIAARNLIWQSKN
ncbi:O-antigen translocase [Neptunitalea lumnitzerae]|uniref:LPS biosynthesis protein n=1 Tax=Neptunitalea lumnitzerae TaxID=2965509 RepID=A0ABQ5MKR9_9FLAO|nr:O-antigen translocase [Neptunitalea sp. Y10]GLB50008.1 LPS biosynthesis protein [Neptunitalea sp. Y10]